ncbi:MAG: hypothetical protein JSW66_05525 [Phycisphaerales bacterium]|nr:MAG: hypothetical protein JSW66_05525 [Phycisphaerales bacterium]
MNRLIPITAVSALFAIFAGCAKPCFYQAGKSMEQCERDLVECLHSPDLTRLYMHERGYQYLDAKELSRDCKRIRVITPFGDYWVADGLGVMANDHHVVSEQGPQEGNPDPPEPPDPIGPPEPPAKRRIQYRVLKDASGQLIKDASGNFVFVPVHKDEQDRETARSGESQKK